MKYRKLLALCAAILCMACLAPCVMATKHTVYFVDNGIGLGTTPYAYIYFDDKQNNAVWPGQQLTATGDFYNGKPIYYCTFEATDYTPTNVIFSNGKDQNDGGKQTADLTFTSDALYDCTANNVNINADIIVKFAPMYLFGNINGHDGWNNSGKKMFRAHQDGEGNFTFTLHVKSKSWFRFYYIDKTYTTSTGSDVTLTAGSSQKATKEAETGAFVLDAPGDYTIKVKYTGSTLTIVSVEKASAPSRTIYVNFGQPLLDNGKRKGNTIIAPKIFLSKSEYENWDNVPNYDAAGGKSMTLVSETMYKYELTDDELYTTCDFVCEFQPEKGDTWRMWAGNAANFDNGNLTKFIYYQGNGTVEQSYITYDQYIAAKEAEKETIYLIGDGFEGLKGFNVIPADISKPDDPASAVCIPITGKHGVFYKDIKPGGNYRTVTPEGETDAVSGAQFKMSWLRPYSYWNQNGRSGGVMDSERSWATFNLGIVGYNQEHEVVTSKKLPVIKSKQVDGETLSVFCTPCRTIPINNINQYNWFIRKKFIEGADTYTLLVDFGNDNHTVTLLPFRLNPTLHTGADDSPTLSVEKLSLGYDETEKVSRTGSLNAEAANGEIRFTDFNVAVLTCALSVPSHDKISNGTDGAGTDYSYEVVYDIYLDGKKAGQYADADKPDKIKLVAVDPATNVKVGVRGRYTDRNTGLTFRSNYDEVDLSASSGSSFDYQTPTIAEVKKTFTAGNVNTLENSDKTDRRYTLGAFVDVTVGAPASMADKVWYADFKLSAKGGYHAAHPELANGGEVVYAGHMAMTSDKSGIVSALDGFAKYAGSGTYGESNNWSGKLAASQHWPLYLQDVVEVKRTYGTENDWQFTETSASADVNVEVSAVYPFLIDHNAKATVVTTGAAENAKAAPRRAPALAADGNYSVKLAVSDPAVSAVPLRDTELTGLRDIIAGQTSGTSAPEYYTIQGVRVTGGLAPGIYICRRGASVEKIMIR